MKQVKNLKWFNEQYKAIGYDIERAKSGHFKVRDPDGVLVTTLAATPSDWRGEKNAQAHLRRHERHRANLALIHAAALRKDDTA